MNSFSRTKLGAIFGGSGWARFFDRLQSYRNKGQPLPANITLDAPSMEERQAVAKILRQAPSSTARLRFDLAQLQAALSALDITHSWEEIMAAVCGPVPPELIAAQQVALGWDRVWNELLCPDPQCPFTGREEWILKLKNEGLAKRLFGPNFEQAFEQMQAASRLLQSLPLEADELLAKLSARHTGDSHALDADRPLATLTLQGLAQRRGCYMPKTLSQKRELWSDYGVVCDDLSAPVLVLNLGLCGAGVLGELVNAAASVGTPLHLSTKLLWKTTWSGVQFPHCVYVCENPAVVSLAAEKLGPRCAPLICIEGNPKTAAKTLLRQLAMAGVQLHYHGDFDWPGLAIAGRLIRDFGAKPWRFSANDYEQITARGRPLEGAPCTSPWCAQLSVVMMQRKQAYHEEALAETLLGDLDTETRICTGNDRPAHPGSPDSNS